VVQWYRDPVSCLQSTLATLLIDAGAEPLSALGLAWEFRYIPGDVRPEEFYWAARHPGDLARSVLPYHDVRSQWQPLSADDPVAEIEAALARGRLPVIAVDNYYLPFRPAYHDLHCAHLIVVSDVDRRGGAVQVSDAMPPAYQGPLSIADLRLSAGSDTPADLQDRFFSGGRTGGRWLDVQLAPPYPDLTPERLADVLAQNLRGFAGTGSAASSPAGHWTGTGGLEKFGDLLATAAAADDRALAGEIYTYGWGPQAQAALHGELLRRCGAAWGRPGLAEAGRRVEQVAHRWSGVRVSAAHSSYGSPAARSSLARHVRVLAGAYQEALAALEHARAELPAVTARAAAAPAAELAR
jgi:hypothetical protein